MTSSTPDALWGAPALRALNPSAITCTDLVRGRLLDRCSLAVPVGMRLLLVGQPEASASMLVRILAGLSRPQRGRDRDRRPHRLDRRRLGQTGRVPRPRARHPRLDDAARGAPACRAAARPARARGRAPRRAGAGLGADPGGPRGSAGQDRRPAAAPAHRPRRRAHRRPRGAAPRRAAARPRRRTSGPGSCACPDSAGRWCSPATTRRARRASSRTSRSSATARVALLASLRDLEAAGQSLSMRGIVALADARSAGEAARSTERAPAAAR